MNDDQIIILNFLRCSPDVWFGKREIARRAVKRKVFEENPRWADEPLVDLIAHQLIEESNDGRVRFKKED